MYEEEDDDLPMQYRRLTAHLQTQNADFDRRLAAYLTNHVAMRSALGQAVSDAWQNNQFNNIGQLMSPNMMQAPQQQQQQQQQQPGMQTSMLPPQTMNRSPTTHRQTPYPMANVQGMRPQHGRSASIATPQNYSYQQQNAGSVQNSPIDGIKAEDRRMSVPVSNTPQTPVSGPARPSSTHTSPARAISRSGSDSNLAAQQQNFNMQPMPGQTSFPSGLTQAQQNAINPLSTELPMESQQLLAANPFEFSLGEPVPNLTLPQNKRTYSYNPNGNAKSSKTSSPTDQPAMPTGFSGMGSSMGGMNATLAPSAFDSNGSFAPSPADSAFSPAGYAFGGMGFSNDMFSSDFAKDPMLGGGGGGGGDSLSGTVTPGEGDWAGFLANDIWEEQPVA